VIEIETDVLIVGGGPVGLTCGALTAMQGAKTLVIDRKAGTSYYPKARALTARSLEILRQLGIEQAVYEAMPAERTRHYAIAPTLVSPEMRLIPFGLGSLDPRPDTPCTGSFCPQDYLEPILETRLRQEPAAQLRFSTELVQLEQDNDGVTAIARDLIDGSRMTIRAKLSVGADGAGSDCAKLAGIAMTRPVELDPALTVIFRAKLAHLVNPLASVFVLLGDPLTGFAGMMSGVSLARDEDEWSLICTQLPDWGTELSEANAAEWRNAVRTIIGIPDLDVEISAVAKWYRTATWAEKLVKGRMVLAGDSAHLMPPAAGLGLNTGLQDAQNLAWRLAAIANGSGLGLLEDYDRERLPEIVRTVEAAVENYEQGANIDRIWNVPQVGLSLGTQYQRGSFADDPEPPPERSWPYHDYEPRGRPGGRAPHFWLDEGLGRSVLDLFGREFVLLTEEKNDAAAEAVTKLREAGAPLCHHDLSIDLDESSLIQWRKIYGLEPDHTVLVRPDGFVCWRGSGRDADALLESFWRIMHNASHRWERPECGSASREGSEGQ